MTRPGKLAAGSGSAFAVGALAGVAGNNLANGVWFWIGFAVLVVVGAGLSAWLTYRGANVGIPVVRHAGNNSVGQVTGGAYGPTMGVNYGTAHGRSPERPEE